AGAAPGRRQFPQSFRRSSVLSCHGLAGRAYAPRGNRERDEQHQMMACCRALVRRAALTVVALQMVGVSAVWAGGLGIYEVGSTDLGTASAGRAALAEDASTAWGNPAGMTRLAGSQLLIGLQPLIVTTEFDVGTRTTTSGTDGGNAGGFVPSGGIYGVYGILPDLKIG